MAKRPLLHGTCSAPATKRVQGGCLPPSGNGGLRAHLPPICVKAQVTAVLRRDQLPAQGTRALCVPKSWGATARPGGPCRDVDGPRLPPRSQSLGYGLVKTGLADRFDEQDRPGLGDDLAAVVLDTDTGIGPIECFTWEVPPAVAGTRTSTILILAVQRHFLLP